MQSLSEYARANNLTLRSNDIYLTADLSAFSSTSIVEEDSAGVQNWDSISAELENYLGSLRGWQSKYREAASADADYQAVKAEYESLQQEVSSWQQKYSEARQGESTSESAYENAVSTAKSKLEAYNQKVRSKEDTIRNNESTVNSKNDSLQNSVQDAAVSGLSDKQKIREYEKQIAACTVKAPRAGVVTSVGMEAGNSYTGGTIAVIEDAGDYEVTAEIDEYDIGKIKVGQKTVIKTNGTGDTEFEGKVKEIAPRATTSGSGSDVTYKVDISIDTPGDGLKLDMTAKLSVVLKSVENVLTVPSDALQEDDDGSYYVEVLRSDSGKSDSQAGNEPAKSSSQAGIEPVKSGSQAGKESAKSDSQSRPDSVKSGSQSGTDSGKSGSQPETDSAKDSRQSKTGTGGQEADVQTERGAGEKPAVTEEGENNGGRAEGKTESIEARGKEQAQPPQTEKITVQKGVESDYYVQIISDRIEEGMQVVVPSSNDQNIQDTMQQMGPMGGF